MRIGYYAHHHGSGHCRQADKLAALLSVDVQHQLTVFTSLPKDAYRFINLKEAQVIRLNLEDELADDVLAGRAGQYWQPASLHYSPVGNSDIQTRSWQLLNAIQQRQIDIMIIDVSAEVAMLCRAASVPYLYVRLPGERDDTAHTSAFIGAIGLLAPYPKVLEATATPEWAKQKTLYFDFLPAAISQPLTYHAFLQLLLVLSADTDKVQILLNNNNSKLAEKSSQPLIVTVIKGYGGHQAIDAKLLALRQALPQALIISLGPINDKMLKYVDIATEVDDVSPFIAHSDWLVMACGLNGVAHAYQYDTPLVVLPDSRPHREQEVMAEALIAHGRALNWQQFMAHIVEGHLQDKSSAYQAGDNTKQPFPSNYHLAAQDFMDSIISYSSAKLWFEDWLLPRLGLRLKI